ncbi:transcriptional regulator ATRX-like [Anneissia japonica]|uniref:transcriptional regulator ATRX-like n=1 Tax=Anneissia japonica TaxID=1529436 RepID=UPI00142599EA|nr:transcriptional regulator ATRX-like [Anneissia japonica]
MEQRRSRRGMFRRKQAVTRHIIHTNEEDKFKNEFSVIDQEKIDAKEKGDVEEKLQLEERKENDGKKEHKESTIDESTNEIEDEVMQEDRVIDESIDHEDKAIDVKDEAMEEDKIIDESDLFDTVDQEGEDIDVNTRNQDGEEDAGNTNDQENKENDEKIEEDEEVMKEDADNGCEKENKLCSGNENNNSVCEIENGQQGSEKKEDDELLKIQINSDGVSTLPDGTIVVQPESVSDNEFKGPEFQKKRNRGTNSDVVRCTSCSEQLNPDIKRYVHEHPSLKVLICRRCYNFYTSGCFTKDEDDIDEQCHWCGEGGKLICCDFCCKVFCRACIIRNLGREELSEILNADEDSKWQCYSCNSYQLADLQQLCTKVLYEKKKNLSNSKSVKSSDKSVFFSVKKHTDAIVDELKLVKVQKFKPQHSVFRSMKANCLKKFVKNLKAVRSLTESLEKQISIFLETMSDKSDEDSESETERKKTKKKTKRKLQNGSLSDSNSVRKKVPKSPRKLKTTPLFDGKVLSSGDGDSSNDSLFEFDVKKRQTSDKMNKEKEIKKEKINKDKKDKKDESSDDSLSKDKGSDKMIKGKELKKEEKRDVADSSDDFEVGLDVEKQKQIKENIKGKNGKNKMMKDEEENEGSVEESEVLNKAESSSNEDKSTAAKASKNANDDIGSESDSESAVERFIARLAKKKRKAKRNSSESEEVVKKPLKKDKQLKNKKKGPKSEKKLDDSDLDISSSDLSDGMEERRRKALDRKGKLNGERNSDGSDQEIVALGNSAMMSADGNESEIDVEKIAEKLVLEEMEAEQARDGEVSSNNDKGDEMDDESEKEKKDKKNVDKSKEREKKEESKGSSDKEGDESDSNDDKKKKKSDENNSSSDDDDDEPEKGKKDKTEEDKSSSDEEESDSDARKKKKKKKSHRLMQVKLNESSNSSEEDTENMREKRASRRAKMMERKRKRESSSLSESDGNRKIGKRKKLHLEESLSSSDEIGKKKNTKSKKSKGKNSDTSASLESESSDEEEEEDEQTVEKDDDEEDEEEEEVKPKKRKKRSKKRDDSSQTSGKEETTKKKKKKRRRRIKMASDSSNKESEDDDDRDEEKSEEPDTPSKGKGRRNIRKVMKDSKLKEETKAAAQLELERRKRVAEKRKEVIDESDEKPKESSKVTSCTLEYDKKKEEVMLEVDKSIAQNLKPHQVKGIQFLWDSTFESLQKVDEPGGGCILAHCMGLGKTLQVIAYIHSVMTSEDVGTKHCLVVAPLNTILNWVAEFEKWLGEDSEIPVYEMSSIKDNWGRADSLRFWHNNGGVMVMGYTMYRNLSTGARIRKKSQKKTFYEALIDPGPDIVVCDEGHMLKNAQTAISKALNQIKTRRRICLTGTPLQNNLVEYHCMVDFVKPSLLGTKKEFCNRFVNPITNGQSSDASRHDVRVMKRRAHVLHDMLSGCVQRRDYSALTNYLPPKYEYVISVRLSKIQIELYEKYLSTYARVDGGESLQRKGMGLFADYQALMRIWTHPWVLRLSSIRDIKRARYDDEMSDFITSGEEMMSDDSLVEFIDDKPHGKKKKEWRGSASSDSEDELMSKAKQKTSGKKSDDEKSDSSVEVVNSWKTRSRTRNSRLGDEEPLEEIIPDPGIPGDDEWYSNLVPEESKNNLEMSGKLLLLMEVLKLADMVGDKVLVFSQSLLSLDLIEDFLTYIDEKSQEDGNPLNEIAGTGSWVKGTDYFRMDGSTPAHMRKRWAEIFNDIDDLRSRLFLISTRAGSLGTNLVAANRVILFDASWNPSHDIQSIFRVYRFGQTKAVYIYRFVAQGTMEEKIYERQVTKQSLSQRVVDEHQIERHFSARDLSELYNFTPDRLDDPNCPERPTPALPKDFILAELLKHQKDWIVKYHEHDSLLENKIAEELTEDERKEAWADYEAEKEGRVYGMQMQQMQQMQPGMSANNMQFMQQFGHLYQQGRDTLMTGQRMLNPMLMQQYSRSAQQNMYNMPNVQQLTQQNLAVQRNILAMQQAIAERNRIAQATPRTAQQAQSQSGMNMSVQEMLKRMRTLAPPTGGPTLVDITGDSPPYNSKDPSSSM